MSNQQIPDDNFNAAPVEQPKIKMSAAERMAIARAAKKGAVPKTSKQAAPTKSEGETSTRLPLRATRVSRRRRDTQEEDALYIDPKMIPEGFSVEWKRISCYGKPETSYLVSLHRQGWEPAPVNMFRHLVGDEYQGKTIDIEGMRLMMRPQSLTDEARQEDYEIAQGNVQNKLKQLGQTEQGHLNRKVQVVKRSYERAPIPSDA